MNLINDDCLNALTNVADKSVNLVIADLPYGITGSDWDKKIDLTKLWEHLKRVGTNNCCYIFFTTTRFGYELIKSNENWFRYDIVWNKENPVGFLHAKRKPMRTHEMIYFFYNKLPTYNIEGNHKQIKNTIQPNMGTTGSCYRNANIVRTNALYEPKLPVSILTFKKTNNGKKRNHPTEKPIDLLEWLIKYYSNEGDIILDPTMGSGSTGVACKNMKRNFIGIEMDKDIFDVAVNRINE